MIQASRTALQFSPLFQIEIAFPYELLLKIATVSVILIVTWIVSKIISGFSSKAVGKLSPKVAQQVKSAIKWLIWLIGLLICLDQLGLELTILLTILILGGILVIVALRDILLNIVSHEAITIYNPFKIGDWIQVGKYFGRIIDINWMNTVLITLDNEIVHIPNSRIVKNMVVNRTASGETRIHVSLVVEDTMDLGEVEKILIDVGNELKEELAPDSNPEVRVTGVRDHCVKLELLLRITNPAKSRLIASEVMKKAKMKLDELKIKRHHRQ
ncbi:MAG: mechanosensitive ion channel family protein [Thermoproteota archaeon]